jgi:hypothetical protein
VGIFYIITKKFIKRAESDVGFMFTAYNLRRLINIVGFEKLMEYMAVLSSFLCRIYKEILGHIKLYKHLKFLFTNPRENSNHGLKSLIFVQNTVSKVGF